MNDEILTKYPKNYIKKEETFSNSTNSLITWRVSPCLELRVKVSLLVIFE